MLALKMPLTWFLFLFISFWPWEKDPGEIKKTSLPLPPLTAELTTLRVALFYEKIQVEIGVHSPYQIQEYPGRRVLAEGAFLADTPIRFEPSGIRVGSVFYPVTGLRIEGIEREVQVEKKRYRNAVQILKNPAGSLTVVNEIDVEEYLKGVLPWEANPEWSEEALKAQAVASRTYAIFENLKNREFPFTLSSDVGSQVYAGRNIEKPSTNRAVEKTRGEILTYGGKIFPAYFHSTCGGRTTRTEFQFKVEPHPSLEGVDCPYCQGSKFYRWRQEFSAEEIRSRLAKKKTVTGRIQSLAPDRIDPSGRPRFFVVRHEEGEVSVPANDFRLAVGPDRMRSTQVKITPKEGGFIFEGKGWGHGVGLCQFGTKQLAELGYRYQEILRYYYPGSQITRLKERGGLPRTVSEEPDEGNPVKRLFGGLKSYFEDL